MISLQREHDTVRESKDPSIIMTACGTTHPTGVATVLSMIWTCLFRFNH